MKPGKAPWPAICGFVPRGSVVNSQEISGHDSPRSDASTADRDHEVKFQLHLDTETVGQVQTSPPLCVEPQQSVRDVLALMKDQQKGAVLVCQEGVLAGIFTERDALRLMAAGDDFDRPVQHVMSRGPQTISVQDTVGAAIGKMSQGGFRHLPIVDPFGKPVGLLQVSAILHYLVQHFPKFVYNLPPKPHHATQQREGA